MAALPKYLSDNHNTNLVFSLYYEGLTNLPDRCEPELLEMEIYGLPYQYECHYFIEDKVKYYFLNLSDQRVFADLELDADGEMAYRGSSASMFYLYYGKAVLNTIQYFELDLDYIFCHDWQTAGVFAFDRTLSSIKSINSCKTVYLIHNYEYQGDIFEDCLTYLPQEAYQKVYQLFARYGSASFLALGLDNSDFVATVSPTYARELTDGLLPHRGLKYIKDRKNVLIPFLNGVDYDIWHPERSPHLATNYSLVSLSKKAELKKEVAKQCHMEFDHNDGSPLVLMMARLTTQKGIQLLADYGQNLQKTEENASRLLESGAKIIVYGTPAGGVKGMVHRHLSHLNSKFEGLFYYNPDYSEVWAHRFLGAADMFLAPSLFEPCGLTQIYAMSFGTIPIVRPVGGLRDTVNCHFQCPDKSTGFYIDHFSTKSLQATLKRVVDLYQNSEETWKNIQQRAMKQDYSWNRMSEQYFDFFIKNQL